MPSLDGVGRYYPLVLHATADSDAPIAPPDIDAQDEWFGVAESFLLSTLAQDVAFDDISARLDGLAVPRTSPGAAAGANIVSLGDAMAGMVTEGADFAAALSGLRAARPEGLCRRQLSGGRQGGGNFRALALSCRGLPDPYRYSTLLTGDTGEFVHAR